MGAEGWEGGKGAAAFLVSFGRFGGFFCIAWCTPRVG